MRKLTGMQGLVDWVRTLNKRQVPRRADLQFIASSYNNQGLDKSADREMMIPLAAATLITEKSNWLRIVVDMETATSGLPTARSASNRCISSKIADEHKYILS